jgi:hypothetical protein
MKIRTGFVSNSSSSSFICCLTGEMNSGMDMCLSDSGMVRCANGHEFLEDLKLENKEMAVDDYRTWYRNWCNQYDWRAERLSDLDRSDEEFMIWFEDEMRYMFEDDGVQITECPVCQFEDLPFEDVAKYFLRMNGMTRKEFARQMMGKYGGDYSKFNEFINSKCGNR